MTRRLASVPDTPRRAVLYVRVSDVRGRAGDTFHSPDMQLEAMRALLARTGGLEVAVVTDLDRTGRNFDRDGMREVMRMARASEIDTVAVYDLSRFGRNTGESLRHIRELRDLGVHVASTVEQVDDSPEGQFMLGQFLGMAQLYSDQTGRRWKQVLEQRARQGLTHGTPPLGYRQGPQVEARARVIEPDPDLAPAVAEAFRRMAAGDRIVHVARDLGARRGRPMVTSVLRGLLRNPVYSGQVRTDTGLVPGQHEALVPVALWEQVKLRLDRDARTPVRRLAIAHPLVGLVVCDGCNGHLQQHARGRGDRVLRCTRAMDHADCPGGGVGTPRTVEVEREVRAQLAALLEELRYRPTQPADARSRKTRLQAEVRSVAAERKAAEKALAEAGALVARKVMSERAYQVTAAELEEAIAQLGARELELQGLLGAPAERTRVREGLALLAGWDAMTNVERHRLLQILVQRVTIRRAAYRGEPLSERVRVVPVE